MFEPQSNYVLPSFEEKTSNGYKQHNPYTKLFEDQVIFVNTGVDDALASHVVAQLLVLDADEANRDRDIIMYVNSPGGSITALTAIYDTMQYVNRDVMTICLGQAASAGSVILTGGTPGKRLILPSARVMIHQPAIGGQGQGQASDIEVARREINRMKDWCVDRYVQHTGQSEETIRKDLQRDKFLTAEEAVAYGLVDDIVKRNVR